jgi:hypothetical protein
MKKLETVTLNISRKIKISFKIMSKDDSTNFKSFHFLRPNFNISAWESKLIQENWKGLKHFDLKTHRQVNFRFKKMFSDNTTNLISFNF